MKTALTLAYQRLVNGETTKARLKRLYSDHKSFSYKQARIHMYNTIDCSNNQIRLIYGGNTYSWKCGQTSIPSANYVNAEHTVPQSTFDEKTPMVSDLHHLFSAPSKLNNKRSNYPFAQVDYSKCKSFCKDNECTTTVPSNPDDYSCLIEGNKWMPRKEDRGQIARAVLYFYTMYTDYDMSDVGDLSTFKTWNKQYPPSQLEKTRNELINQTQGNRNPYIDDYTLVDEAFP